MLEYIIAFAVISGVVLVLAILLIRAGILPVFKAPVIYAALFLLPVLLRALLTELYELLTAPSLTFDNLLSVIAALELAALPLWIYVRTAVNPLPESEPGYGDEKIFLLRQARAAFRYACFSSVISSVFPVFFLSSLLDEKFAFRAGGIAILFCSLFLPPFFLAGSGVFRYFSAVRKKGGGQYLLFLLIPFTFLYFTGKLDMKSKLELERPGGAANKL